MGVAGDEQARDLIRRARQLRQAARVPLNVLAGQVGVPTRTLSAWERNAGIDPARLPEHHEGARRWLRLLAALDAALAAAEAGSDGHADTGPGLRER